MKWSEEEENDLISLLENGFTYLDISIKLNRTKKSVKEKANKCGLNFKSFLKKEANKCLECNKDIEKNKKFCSSSCSAKHNNKKRIHKESNCIVCGNKTKKFGYKFCSNKCQIEHQYAVYIQKWKNDEVDGVSGEYGTSRYIKKYLFEKFNGKCTRCGWGEKNQYTGNIPLEIEHKDGNSKNNKEENLTLLCPNCHSLTETYKGANRGNGRYNRRERYKDKKSY